MHDNHRQRLLSSMLVLASIALFASPGAHAQDLQLPSIFSDHMVLQQGKPVLVWGRDKPGTELVVQYGSQRKKGKARLDGSWSVRLDPLEPGAARTLAITGSSKKAFEDVLVGEVWLCSGQSNMEWPLNKSGAGKAAIAAADLASVRLFKAKRRNSRESHFDVAGGPWRVASSESARAFSAVAWHFGRELHRELGVPIGLVQCAWGGTRIQSWTSPSALENKIFTELSRKWNTRDKRMAAQEKKHDKWKRQAEKAKRNGKQAPTEPRKPPRNADRHRPGGLYLGMAGPLLPFGYAGVIWYQGEANLREAASYAQHKRILIEDWRKQSRQRLPFYWVQLASYHYKNVTDRQLALLWEAQDQARDVERTGMATAVDLGNPTNIHPKNKTEVGRRLSLLALAKVYGKKVESRGPTLLKWKQKGKELHLLFSHCDGGLVARGPLDGFEVAGSKKKFFPARARIDGQTIILTCPDLKSMKAIRYAFRELGPFPLYNQQGLPLTPFRTDAFPIKGQ